MSTKKQRCFIETYLSTWNAARAAEAAGYRHPRIAGARLLAHPEVKAAIAERMKQISMTADEVIARLAQQARADVSLFLHSNGEPNWDMVQKYGYLIKRITKTRSGWQIELHDAQQALMIIAKAQGLLVDRVQQNQMQTQVTFYLPEKELGLPPTHDGGEEEGDGNG